MKSKIVTLIILIVLFMTSLTTLVIMGINRFSKDDITPDPIAYPSWLDESFYSGQEGEALNKNISEYYSTYGSSIDDMVINDGDTNIEQISFVYDWFINEPEYLLMEGYEVIDVMPEEPISKYDYMAIINKDETIDLGEATSINESIIVANELLINGTGDLTIESSILISKTTSIFDELANYESVNINNSIIVSFDGHTGAETNDWSNIHISNSVISDSISATGIDSKVEYENEQNHLVLSLSGIDIRGNVFYDDWFERLYYIVECMASK